MARVSYIPSLILTVPFCKLGLTARSSCFRRRSFITQRQECNESGGGKSQKTGLGKSPIPTAGPLLCGGRGRKSCWRQLLEPRLAGLGQACKAIFPPCRTRSWVMETSSCALELGLREGHSGSHRPGMGGQSVGHAISGLLSEMELDQSSLGPEPALGSGSWGGSGGL